MQPVPYPLRKLRLLALAAAVLSVAGLAACEMTVPSRRFPELSWSDRPPLRLDVAEIDIVQEYQPPAKPPNVEHLFPVRPADAVESWARDRLKAVGGAGSLRVTVVDASVVEVPLEPMGGIRGVFTTEQAERYDAQLEVRLELEADGARATVSSRAERSRTVPEDISLADREEVWFQMTEAMMKDLDASLERQIRTNFDRWLR